MQELMERVMAVESFAGESFISSPRHKRRFLYLSGMVMTLLTMVLFVTTMAYFHQPSSNGTMPYLDFDVFHLAGKLTLSGKAISTYNPRTFFAAELHDSGGRLAKIVPWAYPPQFNLVVAGLALLPKYLGYLLLEGGGLIALMIILQRLSGRAFAEVLFISAPMMIYGVVLGQNGFLTGCLTGWFILAMLQGRHSAGVPLGLMIIKPHLALGFGLYAVVRRDWSVIGIAFGVVFASSLCATLLLTPAIWPAFLGGLSESSRLLVQNKFPDIVFISGYAALRSIGLPAPFALAGQAIEAAFAVWLILHTVSLRLGARMELGVTAVATLAFSPYVFTYDLPILAVGAALLLPLLAEQISAFWRSVLILACYVAGAGCIFMILVMGRTATGNSLAIIDQPPAISSFAFLLVLGATAVMTLRQGRGLLSKFPERFSQPANLEV